MMPISPMMQQYLDVKSRYSDAILMFRVGDFFEMFYDDARTVSAELELTLTGKDCGEEERAPMCGVPYHAADSYINRLVERGHKVVVCDQVEDPALAKGLVKREITRIVTPGTLIDPDAINGGKNNYLAAVAVDGDGCAAAFIDISTGDISAVSLKGMPGIRADRRRLINELDTYKPSELLLDFALSDEPEISDYIKGRLRSLTWENQTSRFDIEKARQASDAAFSGQLTEEQKADDTLIRSVGALLDYIKETQKLDVSYLKTLSVYTEGVFMQIDAATRRNLELTETMRSREKKGSLLWVLDETETSMGARLLRKWVELPLMSVSDINTRQSAVAELYGDTVMRGDLGEELKSVLDIERLMSKVVYKTASARDLRAVSSTIAAIPRIKAVLKGAESRELGQIRDELDELSDVRGLIDSAIVDEPPFLIREGGMIRAGYSEEVDRLRDIMNGGRGLIDGIEARERERTGIPKLKVGYNHVFGYYIEISRINSDKVPQDYIRKQTLVNSERYITPELKEAENTILGASDRVTALEYELFCDVRDRVAAEVKRIQRSAALLALLDVYRSLAKVASDNSYTRPYVSYEDGIRIRDGRHPVVEKFVPDSYFVPNDTDLDTGHSRLLLITGPNMAGKSTYMRQVALITVMAQIGSFVPATDAEIGVVDKVFTRVGASDDLAAGQSTFMLEMTEVANILSSATRRSLIIYDEIGRGTSTYDGMSIARAVAEYTLGRRIGAKTLFATHYHELTSMEDELDGVVNYSIAARKKGEDIVFLRKIVRGGSDDSYGIEVARLAGVPAEVTRRAKAILAELEKSGHAAPVSAKKPGREDNAGTISLEDMAARQIVEKLKLVDINTISPIEAINILFDLKNEIKTIGS
ncbi:MAG: DNA mismatch repair protein MutS [Clostridia bacterium]|nr:DNA mismatch repair protein MutS [Clostridia bacterium]